MNTSNHSQIEHGNGTVQVGLDSAANSPVLSQNLVEALQKKIFEKIRTAQVEEISLVDPRVIEVEKFRIKCRVHSGNHGDSPIENLGAQVSTVGLINPIILLARHVTSSAGSESFTEEKLIVVSGKKRMLAVKAARLDSIPCKVLQESELFPAEFGNLDAVSKDNALSECFQNLAYSESEHTSRLDDHSILLFLRKMRENLGNDDWGKVRKRLGVNSETTEYRNVYRLWQVACSDTAMNLLRKNWVRLRVLKKDHVFRVLRQPEKCDAAVQAVENYVTGIIADRDESEEGLDVIDMGAYSDSEIERLIKEVDIPPQRNNGPGTEAFMRVCEDYRPPNFNVKTSKSRLIVPVISLDFSDRSPSNIRKIVEVSYQISKVSEDIQGFLRAVKPSSIQDETSEGRWEPSNVEHGTRYVEYIRERNLCLYANLFKVNAVKKFVTSQVLAELSREEKAKQILSQYLEEEFSANAMSSSQLFIAAAETGDRERARRSAADDGNTNTQSVGAAASPIPRAANGQTR